MAKYLFKANYMGKGVKGLIEDGGSGRRRAAETLVESVGGTIEAMYYAFGPTDLYIIADVPDHVSAAAVSLTVNASEALSIEVVVLMTPDEIDRAAEMTPSYRPPGG